MKCYSLFFGIFLFSYIQADCQPKFRKLKTELPPPGGYSKSVLAIERKNHECIRINVKSFSQRLKKYPYNKATQIQLVSFDERSIPRLNDTICYSRLKEVKTLTLLQVDLLTNLLYNVGFGGTILLVQEIACYEPRNAIIFIDSSGKAFEYIEICFECERFVVSSEKIEFGDICNQKFSMLKKLFKNAGIQYGTTNQE